MAKQYVGMAVTDFDGTLLGSNSKVSDRNLKTLYRLKQESICRVIATGRSVYSLDKEISPDFPVDYLVFSSGAGIMDWKSREIIKSYTLNNEQVSEISKVFRKHKLNFMVHNPLPDNHRFCYYLYDDAHEDFHRRCSMYGDYASQKKYYWEHEKDASQLLAVMKKDLELFYKVKKDLDHYRVIRTTSPIGGNSIWMEIFPKNVSKGLATKWLCHHLEIDAEKTIGIGNDYNDLELLNFTKQSFVVDNAPEELKNIYTLCSSNDEDGFADALAKSEMKIQVERQHG